MSALPFARPTGPPSPERAGCSSSLPRGVRPRVQNIRTRWHSNGPAKPRLAVCATPDTNEPSGEGDKAEEDERRLQEELRLLHNAWTDLMARLEGSKDGAGQFVPPEPEADGEARSESASSPSNQYYPATGISSSADEVVWGGADASTLGTQAWDVAAEAARADDPSWEDSDPSASTASPPRLRRRWHIRKPPPRTSDPMKIVFVAAEVAPWTKTGGLGDVAGALPQALAARGHRVVVVTPRYLTGGKGDAELQALEDTGMRKTLEVKPGDKQTVSFFHCRKNGVSYVFIDHPAFHRKGGLYGANGRDYDDNHWRFALFSLAALEVPLVLPLDAPDPDDPDGTDPTPGRVLLREVMGQDCVFIANDWHSGLVPVYLASRFRPSGVYKDARSVFAIHNLAYQGVFPESAFNAFGLSREWFDRFRFVKNGTSVNVMQAALMTADRLVTVSQGYASEIMTPTFGYGLEKILAKRELDLNGVVNGVDVESWDPANDPHLWGESFTARNLAGKEACKLRLQQELKLPVSAGMPLVGWVGRLDTQKGPDVLLEAAAEMCARGCQVVVLGSGDVGLEKWVRETQERNPDLFRGIVDFNVKMAHRIIASCDMLLMPSRFEPCGLNQLYAMRYGTIPVVTCVGGLRDTVEDASPFANEPWDSIGTGFTFMPCTKDAMLHSLDEALRVYSSEPDTWAGLQRRGMERDASWALSAARYETILSWARASPPMLQARDPWGLAADGNRCRHAMVASSYGCVTYCAYGTAFTSYLSHGLSVARQPPH